MSKHSDILDNLVLGTRPNERVPLAEQQRQRAETEDILNRLVCQPGVVLADEVGMGKTFVALAVAYCVGMQNRKGPVVIMVPPNLLDKWEQDLDAFCALYLDNTVLVNRDSVGTHILHQAGTLRYSVARHSVEFLKLLDDKPSEQCHIVFLSQGAMSRGQTDPWVRLAMIRETLRRYGCRERLRKVKRHIHKYLGELLYAKGQQSASYWGKDIWPMLLESKPSKWKGIYNESLKNGHRSLYDDPVPEAVTEALRHVILEEFADALANMPIRARGSSARVSERITDARHAMRNVERDLWKQIVAKATWRSPLLILDEAHHLKNPKTALARQLQSQESDRDLKLGDGALAGSFDRMLFLTATPFQLGHQELVRVLQRFGDVCWDASSLGGKDVFDAKLRQLNDCLTASQRAAIRLQKLWSRLRDDDFEENQTIDEWWHHLCDVAIDSLPQRQRIIREAYQQAKMHKKTSERYLCPWVIRHNKGKRWLATEISRRQRFDGATIYSDGAEGGINIPSKQILPFFLAARSAVNPGKDLLGEALCSSYEAFRQTRNDNGAHKDDLPDSDETADITPSSWYLTEFDKAITNCSGVVHPKIHATVQKTVDLWESGEKVLVFAFYRQTCRALRIHISNELENRLMIHARRRLEGVGKSTSDDIVKIIKNIQNLFFDRKKSPGRRALDLALANIVDCFSKKFAQDGIKVKALVEVMRRFLRVQTTLVRAFPIHQYGQLEPQLAVRGMLNSQDASGVSWSEKFNKLLEFLLNQCSPQERLNYLEAAEQIQTRSIHVQSDELLNNENFGQETVRTLANIQVATGQTKRDTRARLMRAFNTPFFPDILVCSQVMGEGVDLHRYCRHVIHHDLDWNPSSIEQRTGRVDRLGCKAENRHPIPIYLPYLAGTADERQYRVMTDRENWFRIVMGQEEVAKIIPNEGKELSLQLPRAFQENLVFKLGIKHPNLTSR